MNLHISHTSTLDLIAWCHIDTIKPLFHGLLQNVNSHLAGEYISCFYGIQKFIITFRKTSAGAYPVLF